MITTNSDSVNLGKEVSTASSDCYLHQSDRLGKEPVSIFGKHQISFALFFQDTFCFSVYNSTILSIFPQLSVVSRDLVNIQTVVWTLRKAMYGHWHNRKLENMRKKNLFTHTITQSCSTACHHFDLAKQQVVFWTACSLAGGRQMIPHKREHTSSSSSMPVGWELQLTSARPACVCV